MRVMFAKSDDGRLCSWRAELPRHRQVRGSTMAARAARTDLPHDLAHFVVEAGLDLEHGFWNLMANGATFPSIRRRPTKPGRQLIAAWRAELNEAEKVVNVQVQRWRDGRPAKAGPHLDAMPARGRALRPGDELVAEWGHATPSQARATRPARPGAAASPPVKLEVRRASDANLGPLVAAFGSRHFFGDCLARQGVGDGVLLVAWLDGRPVGDVFLACHQADEPEVRRLLPGVPRLVHLEVDGRLWRRGIGTALIRAGEDSARRLGHRRLAFGVGVDNPGARRLYERLGYADWGHGTVVGTWQERDHEGPPVTHSEVLDTLVKEL